MFSNYMHLCVCVIIHVLILQQSCTSEPVRSPTLVLSSAGDLEDVDVVMKREHDNLTLTCKLRGDHSPREYVWQYPADNEDLQEKRTIKIEPAVGTGGSKLLKTDLQVSDSGQYTCSAPPFSVTKYILVTAEPRPDTRNKAETEDLSYARLNSIDRHTPNKRRTLRSIDGNHNVYKGTGNTVRSGENNTLKGTGNTVISGENNTLKGTGNTVISGENNTLKGNGNTVKSGEKNIFNGNGSEITGNSNVIRGNNCRVFGRKNVVEGNNNILHGDHVIVRGNNNTIHASHGVFTGDNINN